MSATARFLPPALIPEGPLLARMVVAAARVAAFSMVARSISPPVMVSVPVRIASQ